MTLYEEYGLGLMHEYSMLKRSLDKTTALLISLKFAGGPRMASSCYSGRKSGGVHIDVHTIIREIERIADKREMLIKRIISIENMVDSLPDRIKKLIAWRYFCYAKREAIAKRLNISIRHYSRLRKKGLEAIGQAVLAGQSGCKLYNCNQAQ
ncbi:MAG TPA: hypothetical protein PLZ84_00640 [Clostridia bacterium]|nr:hypothetical protein [Clostridia bacterium]